MTPYKCKLYAPQIKRPEEKDSLFHRRFYIFLLLNQRDLFDQAVGVSSTSPRLL